MRLSVVIPALNEERRLPGTLDRLLAYLCDQEYAWELIVVSNGSTDSTEAVVRHYASRESRIRLLALEERGKGRAARAGALAASGDVVFLCDADLSMPADCLADFLRLIEEADVVVGSREAGGAARYDEPWHRHFMGRVFNRLVQSMAVPGVQDTQCGFKAFRREAVDTLFPVQTLNGFGFDVELLYLARKRGLRMVELGIPWYFDADTRVRPGIDTLNMVGELFSIRLRDVRGDYNAPLLAPGDELGG